MDTTGRGIVSRPQRLAVDRQIHSISAGRQPLVARNPPGADCSVRIVGRDGILPNALSLALAVGLLLTLGSLFVAAGSPPEPATVHPAVWEALQDGREAEILVVLRTQADLSTASALPSKAAQGRSVYETLRSVAQDSQRDLRAILDARGADYQPFYIVNALKVRADSALVRSLASRHEVDRILPNPRVRGLPDLPSQPSSRTPQGIQANLIRVNADDVWALGYTGQGIVVAGQDTGYDWEHPALQSQYRGWDGSTADHNYNWHDAIHEDDPHTTPGNPCGFDSPFPCDDHGSSHGTHTMGTIVGDDGDSHQIGMAPGARWIGCRNMEQGWGTPATYIECFEFFLAPYPLGGDPLLDGDPLRAPHVVNNSWACPPSEGCDPDHIALMEGAVEVLRQAGIVVVASAGNYGSACGSVQYPPAIYPQSFAIGNFDHRTDQIYGNSSRGPVTYGDTTYTKPDLSAPGVSIYSSMRGSRYGTLTGTSMSAPHVAGAIALLLSAAPGYSGQVDAIQHLLTHTTQPMTTTQTCGGDGPADVPNNTWGWGILDILSTVREATAGTLGGTVADASDGTPIAGTALSVTLQAQPGLSWSATSDPTGSFTFTLPAGIYDLTAQAAGYVQGSITGVPIISGTITTQDLALDPLRRIYLPLLIASP
jgi:serine protease AprX